jgi:hypothetical protein
MLKRISSGSPLRGLLLLDTHAQVDKPRVPLRGLLLLDTHAQVDKLRAATQGMVLCSFDI